MADTALDTAGDSLTKKVGPFPGYVYVAAAVVAYVLYRRYFGGSSGGGGTSAAGVADTTSLQPATYSSPAYATGYSSTTAGSSLFTNQDWANQAINALIGSGVDAGQAETAIASYLSGTAVNSQQQALISRSIQSYGSPPGGALAIVSSSGQTLVGQGYSVTNPPQGAQYILNQNNGEIDQIWPDGSVNYVPEAAWVSLKQPDASRYYGTTNYSQAYQHYIDTGSSLTDTQGTLQGGTYSAKNPGTSAAGTAKAS